MKTLEILADTFKSFSKDELINFKNFIRSPYHKKRHVNSTKILLLFNIITKNKLKLKGCDLFNIVFSILYPDNKSEKNNKEITNLIYGLNMYFLDFCCYELLNKNLMYRKLFILFELYNRNAYDIFQHNLKSKFFNIKTESPNELDNFYFYKLFSISNKFKQNAGKIVDEGDYEIEKDLFRKYFYNEFVNIITRERTSKFLSLKNNVIF